MTNQPLPAESVSRRPPPVLSTPRSTSSPGAATERGSRAGPHRGVAYAEFFSVQPTSSTALPDPIPLLENLARSAIEVLAGARDLDQLSRWLSDDVYTTLLRRVIIATRARQATGSTPSRPAVTVGRTRVCEPRDGVVEGVVIVHGKARTRAVAIRLEGYDNRWRASALHIL